MEANNLYNKDCSVCLSVCPTRFLQTCFALRQGWATYFFKRPLKCWFGLVCTIGLCPSGCVNLVWFGFYRAVPLGLRYYCNLVWFGLCAPPPAHGVHCNSVCNVFWSYACRNKRCIAHGGHCPLSAALGFMSVCAFPRELSACCCCCSLVQHDLKISLWHIPLKQFQLLENLGGRQEQTATQSLGDSCHVDFCNLSAHRLFKNPKYFFTNCSPLYSVNALLCAFRAMCLYWS